MTTIQLQSGYDEFPTSNDTDHFRLVSSHYLKSYLDTTCIKYINKQEGSIYAYNDIIIPFLDTTKTFEIIVDGLGKIDGSVSGKIYTDIDPSFFSIGKYTDDEYGGIYIQNLKNQEFFYASYFFN
jgi:hypothetical protein